jgi:hypothetical protein
MNLQPLIELYDTLYEITKDKLYINRIAMLKIWDMMRGNANGR